MLLFSRIVTPHGSPRRSIGFALEATAYVNANSSLQLRCWSGGFGYPVGTVGWSCFAESQAELAAATSDLLSQSAYHDLLESGEDLLGTPGQDTLTELVYGAPSEEPPIGAVGVITRAVAVVDRMADAVTYGVEVAQHVESVTSTPVAFCTDLYGPMGGMAWISVGPDAAAADEARGKLLADAGHLAKLKESAGLFIPGSGHTSMVTRIG